MSLEPEWQEITDVVRDYLNAVMAHDTGQGYSLQSKGGQQFISSDQWSSGLDHQDEAFGKLVEIKEIGSPVISSDGTLARIEVKLIFDKIKQPVEQELTLFHDGSWRMYFRSDHPTVGRPG